MADPVVLMERDGPVAVITLNRPRSHNALNRNVLQRLDECLTAIAHEASVNVVVLAAAGEKSFCAGADLDELTGLDGPASREVLAFGQEVMHRISTSRIPIISAVNGAALGGGFELILATTFPVLATSASLGLPEAGLGLIPGYGGTQRLPLLIGRASAAHVMLTGERLSAERAFQLGLTPVAPVAPDELLRVTLDVARKVAERGPRAVSAILEAMGTFNADLAALAHETTLAAMANGGAEAREGVAAFKDRRPPRFPSRSQAAVGPDDAESSTRVEER